MRYYLRHVPHVHACTLLGLSHFFIQEPQKPVFSFQQRNKEDINDNRY